MCNNVQQQMSHASRHCTSWVAGPGQCPGIHQVNWAAISSLSAWISTGKVVVVAMCAVATATSIASLDDCSISSLSHRQPAEDGGDGQNIHYLLSRDVGTLDIYMLLLAINLDRASPENASSAHGWRWKRIISPCWWCPCWWCMFAYILHKVYNT